jgi:hypothetical protein
VSAPARWEGCHAKSPMYVAVSLPSLDRLSLRGAGTITGINSRNVTVALPGSGNIDAGGTTTKLHVTISSEGTAQLRSSSRATRKPRSMATAPSRSPRPAVSPGGSQAPARSYMAATPAPHPDRHDQGWIVVGAYGEPRRQEQPRDRQARLTCRGSGRRPSNHSVRCESVGRAHRNPSIRTSGRQTRGDHGRTACPRRSELGSHPGSAPRQPWATGRRPNVRRRTPHALLHGLLTPSFAT